MHEIFSKDSAKHSKKYSRQDAKRERKHLYCHKLVWIACGNKHLKCLSDSQSRRVLSDSTALTVLVKKHVDQ